MRIAILGGTGAIGEGLAVRIGRDTDHEVVIGSREPDRASNAATRYLGRLRARGYDPQLSGRSNERAVEDADLIVAAIPPYSVADAIEGIADAIPEGSIVVSPAVGLKRDEAGVHYHRPSAGSVTALAAQAAPAETPVVGAFHSLPAARLVDLDDSLELDTIVVGDDGAARRTVIELAGSIDGLTALDGGPLANAPEVEAQTALLINLGRYNEHLHDAGFRIVAPGRSD
ncbi:MAG: NADPH-dependent F420 reductase [Halobacteriota archaeon]